MGIVLLQYEGKFVAQVPLLNFRTFASEKVEDLVEVSEAGTRRYKFYTYSGSFATFETSFKRWATWLTHRDLRAFKMDGPDNPTNLIAALGNCKFNEDDDYQDAMIDAWVSWLKDGKPIGDLNVERLQRTNFFYTSWTGRLVELKCALILHHDAKAVSMKDSENLSSPYSIAVCQRVRDLALISFAQPDRKPTDPLQMSDDQFCEAYHSHSQHDQPCYKTKSLPEQL